ncbi:DNA-directed RNA polymerase subunit omega [Frisingicoccus sp.]|uniref:DNA-directed RNA polymerase subunit omega n=1 Tax=Frisingicoccus sp. TaxID=1918627 RepID=UPI003999B92F
MLHPSYSDLIEVVNSGVEEGEAPVVQSRYSIVIATAKRARQLISGAEPLVDDAEGKKPLSIAVEELYSGNIKILGEDEEIGGDMLELSEDISDEEVEISEEEAEETAGEAEPETEA